MVAAADAATENDRDHNSHTGENLAVVGGHGMMVRNGKSLLTPLLQWWCEVKCGDRIETIDHRKPLQITIGVVETIFMFLCVAYKERESVAGRVQEWPRRDV